MVSNHGESSQGGEKAKLNVLFCCLGNICRSPMALAVFEHTANMAGVRSHFGILDSCGTAAYHTGEEPDERTTQLCQRRNIPIDLNNTARAITRDDFFTFDVIFGMDTNNVRNLKSIQPPASKAHVRLFGHVDDNQPVADSYYTGDFETTYKQVLRYSHAYLAELGLTKAKS
ncbi:putative protein-tyrosine-phosphatase [Mycosarcoma maydis]|uniref:Phosphotyrosine protein phosphatase I domain-containing protein n=1 Tax=Mycosarcoma maydis TaxID=5270 RepID=A0A0D1E586_MYCMD|nr:putative protein-tyrosine-phosphatase [Ustilago maydis 521]KIS69530.1 putative protein-tyrosine-phosphatase [Ustilago maydis 521]|eukprot:XP_011388447.1 putative protein-tyrosine-phosphatase [Ustilago maydis 521]